MIIHIVIGVILVLVVFVYFSLVQIKQRLLYAPHKLSACDSPASSSGQILHTFVRTTFGNDLLSVAQSRRLSSKQVVVLTHGNYGNLSDYYPFFDWIDSLVLWDYRGYGRSTGTPHERNNAWDLGAVVDAIPEMPERLVLVGHSLGTNVTLSYLSYAMDHGGRVPQVVVLIHPFLKLSDILVHKTGWSWTGLLAWMVGDMDQTDTIHRFLEHNPANQLHILYAPRDRVTPSQPVLQALGELERIKLHNVGGEHHSVVVNSKIFAAIKEILNEENGSCVLPACQTSC